ncbi:MAG: hypothetical protein NW224_22590 [Leptolyngbyaceae cyanobacterium bins.302]|nr:hypothetical protein [Leptolyngbyaceae cyanobacterium bins.302]
MKHSSAAISACRHCRFYSPQGRRGGYCKKLNVSVKGQWEACSLATPPFAATWRELESITVWTQKALIAEDRVRAVEGSLATDLFEAKQTALVPCVSRASRSSWM